MNIPLDGIFTEVPSFVEAFPSPRRRGTRLVPTGFVLSSEDSFPQEERLEYILRARLQKRESFLMEAFCIPKPPSFFVLVIVFDLTICILLLASMVP